MPCGKTRAIRKARVEAAGEIKEGNQPRLQHEKWKLDFRLEDRGAESRQIAVSTKGVWTQGDGIKSD